MKIVRVVDPDRIQSLHVAMVCLLGVAVAGSCLLTSGPLARMEGSRDWHEESPLRAIVHVLNLNYTQTTAQGVEIKALVFGVGASLAALACGLAMMLRSPAGEEVSSRDTSITSSQPAAGMRRFTRRQMGPLTAAQVLMGAYVIWSFLSAQWSTAPDLALGGSVLLAAGVVWAIALGRGLNRPTAAAGALVLLGICTVTALMAIAYYGERNPTRRASYPVGNPLFLAACLIPGVLLSIGLLIGRIRAAAWRAVTVFVALLGVIALAATVWTIYLTLSRTAALALGVGMAAMLFFSVPQRFKWLVAFGIVVTLAAGLAYAWPRFTAPSSTGRDATLRLRHYAWWYAIDMIEEAPIIGQGQGAYTQFGDALASQDVVNDPQALEARIAHAHNEWLEVGADLGAVGVTLVLGSLALTIWAGMLTLPHLPNRLWRWTLVALLASLAALIVEEASDVALRIAGFPAVFYTVIGLVWALSRPPTSSAAPELDRRPIVRVAGGVVALAIGAAALLASMADFRSARAFYETAGALQERAFDTAVNLARRACAYRLSPQRRLESLERLCSTHLYIARAIQTTSLNRLARARQTDPPDERLLQLANEDRTEAERHIEQARSALESLVRRSPTYLGAGWLEYRLNQLLNVFARVDGDDTLAARATTAAALALDLELHRSPYDPLIAISFIEVARDRLDLPQVFDILARPLRREPMPVNYSEFMMGVTQEEGFDEDFKPIWQRIARRGPDVLRDDPLAPEKLRLAALIRFTRQDYAKAFDTSRLADALYEQLPLSAAIGAASCLMETAEYLFFADPDRWSEARDYAERGLALLPDSTPGREIAKNLRARLAVYSLAGGEESFARNVLVELLKQPGKPLVDAELGRYYTTLCESFIHRSRGALPQEFAHWVARAIELRPRDELAWRLNAQIAFDEQRFHDAAAYLRRALELGGDPGAVYSFVELGAREHPESRDFQALLADLRGLMTGADTATQPDLRARPNPSPPAP